MLKTRYMIQDYQVVEKVVFSQAVRVYSCEFVAEDIFVYDKNNNF